MTKENEILRYLKAYEKLKKARQRALESRKGLKEIDRKLKLLVCYFLLIEAGKNKMANRLFKKSVI